MAGLSFTFYPTSFSSWLTTAPAQHPSAKMLSAHCKICSYPAWSADHSDQEISEVHIDSFADLRTSAHEGCPGCQVLRYAWESTAMKVSERQRSLLVFNRSRGHLYIHIFRDNVQGTFNLDVYTLPGEPSFMHVSVASPLPPSTHLQHSLPRIRSWLDACEEKHWRCNRTTSFTPSRLLDIMLDDAATIKLVEVKGSPDPSPHYACLSHCWGGTRSKHITRASNLSQNLHRIPVPELPKTF